MKTSESLDQLAPALAAAQAAIEPAVKDKVNPHFKSRYADLAAIWDACRGPLTANGLSLVQPTRVTESGDVLLETILLHTSGQWVASEIPVYTEWNNQQRVGSALTYLRRYALAALVGVAPDDDDGEAAVAPMRDAAPARNNRQPARVRQAPKPPPESEPFDPPPKPEKPIPHGYPPFHEFLREQVVEANHDWADKLAFLEVPMEERKRLLREEQVIFGVIKAALQASPPRIKPDQVDTDGKRDLAKCRAHLTKRWSVDPARVADRIREYIDGERLEAEKALREEQYGDAANDDDIAANRAAVTTRATREPGED